MPKWVLVVLAFALVVGIDWQSSTFSCIAHRAIEERGKGEQAADSYEKSCPYSGVVFGSSVAFIESIDWTPEAITAAATVVIASFTVVLGIATGLQYRAVMAQVRLARDEFNATHRPKIEVLSFEPLLEGLEEEKIQVFFTYVNRGASLATIVEIATKIVTNNDRNPLRPGVILDRCKIRNTILESGERHEWTVDSNILLSHHKWRAEPDAPKEGYVVRCVGCIRYADARGTKRETGFCRRLSGDGTQWFVEQNSDYEYSY
jgi:hypothetical protein